MLQSPSLIPFVNSTIPYKTLGDSLLPINNNSEFLNSTKAITVTICNNEDPVAFGSIVKCNEKQAYVMLGEVAKDFQNKTVWIEKVDSSEKLNKTYKITKCVPLMDYSGETHFEQTFGNREEKPVHLHLLDILIQNSVGLQEMDVMKNITVDFEKYNNFSSWRDTAGFVVGDRNLYEKLTVNRFELLSLEPEESTVTIENVDVNKPGLLIEYDSEVSLFDREDFMLSLLKTQGVTAKVATLNGNAVGYVVKTEDNVLQCYGEDESIQRALLASAATDMKPKVNIYTRKDSNETIKHLSETALDKMPITRMNTRVVVNTIKWGKVACLNMGLHLF